MISDYYDLGTEKGRLREIIYNEGNFEEWRDENTGYLCRIIRPYNDGHLCGYVSVPETHPYFGKDYVWSESKNHYNVKVHGGLTYSSDMGVKGRWWLGFDCVHLYDLNPRDVIVYGRSPWGDKDVYRTKDYVKKECESLAKQLKELEGC